MSLSQEFQRLTDRIEILTKARDSLTEYLREVEYQNNSPVFSSPSPINDVPLENSHYSNQSQYSPLDKSPQQPKISFSPNQLNSKDIYIHDYSTPNNDQQTTYHYYPSTPPISTHVPTYSASYFTQRSRSPSMTPSNFIRVRFPNKHTTAVS